MQQNSKHCEKHRYQNALLLVIKLLKWITKMKL